MVEHEDGRKVILSATNKSQREAIAKRLLTPVTNEKPQLGCKKVLCFLQSVANGKKQQDCMLFFICNSSLFYTFKLTDVYCTSLFLTIFSSERSKARYL